MKQREKKKLTIKIELYKDGVITDWSEYKLGNKLPDKVALIKNLIDFLEETI